MQTVNNKIRSFKYRRSLLLLLWLCTTGFSGVFIISESGNAETLPAIKNATRDSKWQIAEFDGKGKLSRLHIDTDKDGHMDAFQYYDKGTLIRIERDTDADRRVDTIDYFEEGRRVRQEVLGKDGNVLQEAAFDTNEQVSQIREDTMADGHLDTVYLLDKGHIIRVMKDTTGDGLPNIRESYQEGKPHERCEDLDGDGVIEQTIIFDTRGVPIENTLDTDKDGYMDVFQKMKNNIVENRRTDKNHDGKFETAVYFEDGKILRLEEDVDMDGYRETVTYYTKDRPVRQIKHSKLTGKPISRHFFDAKGQTERVEKDLLLDGQMDTFQTYQNNALVAVERDANGDGRIDLKVLYEHGKQKMLTRDRDHDGRFETTQSFDRSPWDYLMEVDLDGSGTVDERYFYMANILRRKDQFEKKSRRMTSRYHYGKNGQLQKREIFEVGTGQQKICWMYNEAGEAVEAFKDQDKNGQADIWFHYRQGLITFIEEDSNGDGKKDIWETYDEKENLILRKKDIDFDGVADIEE